MAWPAFSSRRKADRLRTVGALTLVFGIAGACLFYWYQTRTGSTEPRLEDLLPRYEREETHDIGVQMGTLGIVLMRWQRTLQQPAAQAVLVAGGAALFAAGFFRAARIADEDDREREKPDAARTGDDRAP